MFVRRLLVSAALACLSACASIPTSSNTQQPDLKQKTQIGNVSALNHQTTPKRNENPHSTTTSQHSVMDTSACLRQKLTSEFKLPAEFINHKVYSDNNHSVGLINPFTQTEGITMDVISRGAGSSEVKLYANGNLLSRAWQQLPSKCGQGKTTTVAQVKTPTTSNAATHSSTGSTGVNFVALTQNGTNNAWVDAGSTKAASVQTTSLTTARTPSTDTVPAPTAHISTTTQHISTAQTSATPNQWPNTNLTQDDMSIIAPLTAAVVATPLAAKALQNQQAAPTQALTQATIQRPAARSMAVATPNDNHKTVAVASTKPKASTAVSTSKPKSTTAKAATPTTTKKAKTAQANTKTTQKTAKKSTTKSNSSKEIVSNKKATRNQANQKTTATAKKSTKANNVAKNTSAKANAKKANNKKATAKPVSKANSAKATKKPTKNNQVEKNKKAQTKKSVQATNKRDNAKQDNVKNNKKNQNNKNATSKKANNDKAKTNKGKSEPKKNANKTTQKNKPAKKTN